MCVSARRTHQHDQEQDRKTAPMAGFPLVLRRAAGMGNFSTTVTFEGRLHGAFLYSPKTRGF